MKNRFYIHAKTKPEDHLCEALLVCIGFAIGMTILEHNAKGARAAVENLSSEARS